MSHSTTSYWFGPFELRVEQGVLLRDEELIPLSPQLFDLLLILIESQGYIVSKEKLIEKLWSGDKADKVLLDGRLQRLISDLRNELECGKELIETKSKKGYRFIELVRKDSTLADKMESNTPSKVESPLYTQLIERINRTTDLLPKGASNLSWIIGQEILESWKARLSEFVSKGIGMSRSSMMACNNELFEAARSAVIVESRCFNYKKEWSKYWIGWLEGISKRTDIATKEYYVLVAPEEITSQDIDNLFATGEFLSSVGFSLSICERRHLEDFLGEYWPHFDSLNIFGRFVLHLDIPSTGESEKKLAFAGGHKLWVHLHDAEKEPIYANICRLIQENSEKVTPALIETLQK